MSDGRADPRVGTGPDARGRGTSGETMQLADARARAARGQQRRGPADRGRGEDTTLRGGLLGITAVTLATAAISLVGLLVSVVVALLY